MSDNTVTVVGNLVRPPELRFTPSGASVVSFGMAVNRRWLNKQTQQWEEETSFFDVKAWQTLAENIAESLDKGMRAIVTGRLEQRSWETDDGQKRSKVEIVATEVAPSLRWATAQVTKVESSSGTGGYSGGGGQQSAAASNTGGGFDDYSEQPF